MRQPVALRPLTPAHSRGERASGRATWRSALLVLLAITPAVAAESIDWPMFGRDAARTGASPTRFASTTLGKAWATLPPRELFVYVEGVPYWSSPSLATVEGEPRVFLGCYDRNVYAFDGATGAEAWTFTTGDAVGATPTCAVINGRPMLFVASSDRSVYALDPSPTLARRDDRVLWQVETFPWRQTVNPARMANPLVAEIDGKPVLFCGVWNNDQSGTRNVQRGEIIAFEPRTGDIAWRRVLGTGAVSTPCLGTVGGEPALFVPYEPGAIFAISARDGHDLWPETYAAAEELHGGLSLGSAGGRRLLFFGGRTAWAYAVDAETGKQAWDVNVGTWVDSTPAFAVIDDRPVVFFGTYTYFVVACDAATGEILWRFRTRGIIQGAPAVATMGSEPVVCVNSLDNHVYVLGARDGRFLFRHHIGKFPWTHYLKGKTIWSSCVVGTLAGEPTLVAPSYSGVVHAFTVNGEDANQGPPQETLWDALGADYTIPVVVVVAVVLVLTFLRLLRRRSSA